MSNSVPSNFVNVEFIEDTFYKGSLRVVGEKFDVDGSYAKNFIAQGRAILADGKNAVAIENSSDNELKSKLEALKEKLPELSVGQIAKQRKDVLVALAFDRGIATVPDDMGNKEIAQLIYDDVHGKSE